MDHRAIVKRITPKPGDVKVWTTKDDGSGAEEVTMIRVPVSSTKIDRDGDRFSRSGLEALKAQLDTGEVPMFMDHGMRQGDFFPSYAVRGMFGGWTKGDIEEQGDDARLFATGKLQRGHADADDVKAKLEQALPVGWSVGFIDRDSKPMDPDADPDDMFGARIFQETDLLEVSAVGIPSNPDGVASISSVLAKHYGLSSKDLLRKLNDAQGQDVNPMGTQTKQEAKTGGAEGSEKEKKGAQDGDGDEAPESVTMSHDELEALLVKAARKGAESVLTKMEEDDEDEDDDEDKGKSSRARNRKGGKPRGIATGKATKDDEAKLEAARKAAEVELKTPEDHRDKSLIESANPSLWG